MKVTASVVQSEPELSNRCRGDYQSPVPRRRWRQTLAAVLNCAAGVALEKLDARFRGHDGVLSGGYDGVLSSGHDGVLSSGYDGVLSGCDSALSALLATAFVPTAALDCAAGVAPEKLDARFRGHDGVLGWGYDGVLGWGAFFVCRAPSFLPALETRKLRVSTGFLPIVETASRAIHVETRNLRVSNCEGV